MPKENRFAGLGEAMQSESTDDDAEAGDESEQQDEAVQGAAETEVDSTSTDVISAADEETTPRTGTEGGEQADERQEPEDRTTESSEEEDESSEEEDETGEEEDETGEEEDEASEEEDETGEAEAEESGPAFEFEATTAKSIYVRKETLERLDDAEFEVESLLRREHDIRDLTGREFHDALIHVAATYVDEIADVVVETRQE